MDGEPIEAADYRELVQVEAPRLSPDGNRVAFVRTVPEDDESYEATVYVVPVDGGEPRRFTAAEGTDGSPRWSPGGDALAFTSDRADADAPQLWLLPTDGGEAERRTDVPGGVSDPAWSPDAERVAFTASTTATEREAGHELSRSGDPAHVVDRLERIARWFDGYADHVDAPPATERGTDGLSGAASGGPDEDEDAGG